MMTLQGREIKQANLFLEANFSIGRCQNGRIKRDGIFVGASAITIS
jgi:hypothetical protein